jgi:hypothetical protein
MEDDLFDAVVGDGRSLLIATALVLMGSGAFASFQAATGHFLPHDTAYLGMTAADLCRLQGCRILYFMIHDRISFGGVLIATGAMYLWLAAVPLRKGEAWAWWALAASGVAGFLSFLAYLGYGYLDTWHGAATLALLPLFASGMFLTRALRSGRVRPRASGGAARFRVGRVLLLGSTFGITAAGLTIMTVGMTRVFVPQDLEFMGLTAQDLHAVNPRLVPLIAHDRAGFGGALVSCGIAMFLSVLHAVPSRSLWQVLLVSGVAGFGTAVGVHPAIGYTTLSHLGPAVFGAGVFAVGLALTTPATPGSAAVVPAASPP